MNELWLPKQTPPQISLEARDSVSGMILEHGVFEIGAHFFSQLDTEHEAFAEYLDQLGFALNHISSEDYWPERLLKTGAVLAMLGYQASGYLQSIDDDAVSIGKLIADFEGIPEAYASRYHDDQNLTSLIDTANSAKDFTHDEGGYAQVLRIGAGCTRHYMQQAIAA